MIVLYGVCDKMQKPLGDKRDLPSPTSTRARWWSRASSSSAPPGMHFSGEHRQQQERKKYSQVHCYLEELMVSKENNGLFYIQNEISSTHHGQIKRVVFYFSLLVKLMLALWLSSPRQAPKQRYQWATNFVIS